MKQIKIGSGTTVNFTLPMPQDVGAYDSVRVNLFTNKNTEVKFSYPAKTGYETLTIGTSPSQLVGKLKSTHTAKMVGPLYMGMKIIDEVTDEAMSVAVPMQVGKYVDGVLTDELIFVDNFLKNETV